MQIKKGGLGTESRIVCSRNGLNRYSGGAAGGMHLQLKLEYGQQAVTILAIIEVHPSRLTLFLSRRLTYAKVLFTQLNLYIAWLLMHIECVFNEPIYSE